MKYLSFLFLTFLGIGCLGCFSANNTRISDVRQMDATYFVDYDSTLTSTQVFDLILAKLKNKDRTYNIFLDWNVSLADSSMELSFCYSRGWIKTRGIIHASKDSVWLNTNCTADCWPFFSQKVAVTGKLCVFIYVVPEKHKVVFDYFFLPKRVKPFYCGWENRFSRNQEELLQNIDFAECLFDAVRYKSRQYTWHFFHTWETSEYERFQWYKFSE